MFRPMKVTFHMDGTGVYIDPLEPIMLDGLLAYALCRFHVHGEPPARNEEPAEIPLPLRKWHIGDHWGWHASAIIPDGDTRESIQFWRKRFRENRVSITAGSPNITNGTYRSWNMPIPLTLCNRMVGYAHGEIGKVRRELRRSIRYLGKKRSQGRGAVVSIDVEEIPKDLSISMDGLTMRWMPSPGSGRLVRTRPPYWNAVGRVECSEIGDRR